MLTVSHQQLEPLKCPKGYLYLFVLYLSYYKISGPLKPVGFVFMYVFALLCIYTNVPIKKPIYMSKMLGGKIGAGGSWEAEDLIRVP